jgi:Ca2+-binding RTX toxin-like protein
MTTNFKLKPFKFNLSDLNFIRDQINFRPLFDSHGNAIIAWNGTGSIYDAKGVQYDTTGLTANAAVQTFGSSYTSVTAAQGLRDVTGENNNLHLVNRFWGAVDQPFLRSVAPDFEQYIQPTTSGYYGNHTFTASNVGNTDYSKRADNPATLADETAADRNVVDYTPRMISRTITTGGATPLQDATVDHGQVLHWSAARYTTDTIYAAAIDSAHINTGGLIEGAAIVRDYGILAGGQHDPQDRTNGELFFGAINPGVAPGNSFLAYFGQFFDHGLDFISKGSSGTKITIPLSTDDPLYRAPGTNGPSDFGNTKITISRADVSGFDAQGNAQWINHTSPYIDQSQTYGSHAQMTALLREWVSTDGAVTFHAGAHLLDGATSASWKNAWGETTTATLPTLNELRKHLVDTGRDDLTWEDVSDLRNRDASGDVAIGVGQGSSGQALLLDMNPRFDTAHITRPTTIAALAAIGIVADGNGNFTLGGPPGTHTLADIIDFRTFTPLTALAKEVLLESVGDHYIAGDGRVNENIGLTTIHHVFHEEHNYQVRNLEEAILAQDARAVTLGDSTHTIAHEWQIATTTQDAAGNYTYGLGGDIAWNESRLFDAAKLTVEMEYQHAAVDQYARTITPDIPEFVGYNSGTNGTVSLEYAQGAFRFGHSTMRETINTMDPHGSITGKVMSLALEQAFLNPALFAQQGAAAIALGLTHQQMNEVDELITPALNQGLLGLPLDLASINIARGRDIGLPTLNDFRDAVGLSRYASWSDFGNHMVHPESLANFIAAYSFDGDVARASAIVKAEGGDSQDLETLLGVDTDTAINYAIDFLNADPAIAGSDGFNHIDTWLGGLAEVHVMGGLLGETFNLVFVDQINRLMDGDRFYYLYRLDNLNVGDEIANAQLKDIIERNTGLEHLNGSAFAYADQYIDLSAKVDIVHNADSGNFRIDHKYGQILEDRANVAAPAIGVYSLGGNSWASNGAVVTVGGVQYIRDVRAAGANGNNNVNGTNLDGTPDTGANSNEVLIGTDNRDLLYMGAGDDTAYGEGGDDTLYGDAGIDRLYGGDGNDTIYGGDSGDLIDGGDGDDKLYGDSSGSAAAGVDQIIGGAGNDLIYGGIGIDKLSGGQGDDVIFGGGDTDAFTHGGDGNDYIDGQSDGDLLWGDGGDDLIVGGNNQDIVAGLDGDDILRPGNPSSAAGGGPDEVLGGDGRSDLGNDGKGVGFDMIDFSDYVAATTGVRADFATQQNPLVAIDGTTPFPAWVGIEGAIGSRNNDTFIGDANNNWLIGGSGNDTLTGGAGNDVIVGDGIRLDSLIGTYSGGYNHYFDGASHRATGFIGTNGLLDNVGAGFDKHYTEMLKTDLFKNIELGGSTLTTLNGVADTQVGDGGVAGTGDTVTFAGNRADYAINQVSFMSANQGMITAYKVTDSVAGRDATDVVVGVEFFKFADMTVNSAGVLNIAPVITSDGGGATAAKSIAENTLVVTQLNATAGNIGSTLSYSIIGGADALRFAVNGATGALSFVVAPNFEGPIDAGADNVYNVVVQVTDGVSFDSQALAVTVLNVNETGSGELHIANYAVAGTNATASLTAVNTLVDPDAPLWTPTYQWQSLVGAIWTDIAGATNATLAGQSNITARVVSVLTDAFGSTTTVSAETAIIGTTANNATVAGTAGVDFQLGLAGNDTLQASAGNDTIDGGVGTDTYSLAAFAADATVNLSTGSAFSTTTGIDQLIGIENVTGGAGNDTLTDSLGTNTLDGGAGADKFIMTVDNARDTLVGAGGSDTVNYSAFSTALTVNFGSGLVPIIVGGSGTTDSFSDTVSGIENFIGGSGNDNITGDLGVNDLMGGDGNDTLRGGLGTDRLTGGNGADVFDFNSLNAILGVVYDSTNGAANRDIIADFVSGVDKLDLAGIDANVTSIIDFTDQAFNSFGFGTIFTAARQLRYHYEIVAGQEYTVIQGNVNTNLAADFEIALVGHIPLVITDIVL